MELLIKKFIQKLRRILRPFKTIPSQVNLSKEDENFRAFIKGIFNYESYLNWNPDVKAAGIDPLYHWLNFGMNEGRPISPFTDVVFGTNAHCLNDSGWQHFLWRGLPVAVRERIPRPQIIEQIIEQAEFDTAVIAAGADAIENLKYYKATDLMMRDSINTSQLFEELTFRPSTVVVTPFLCVGGAEKYISDLVQALSVTAAEPILVVVTDDTEQTCQGWDSLGILAPLKNKKILFWRDLCESERVNPTIFARFINAIRPKILIVNNSRVGYDAVANHGLLLSQHTRIFCTFFSLTKKAIGAPYGGRYPYKTMPFSVALTDNSLMHATLSHMWGGVPGPGVVELPAKVEVIDKSIFIKRLESRCRLCSNKDRRRRWLWISRIEPYKGTKILAAIARMRPADSFELFGPIYGNLENQNLEAPNILYKGIIENIENADLSSYEGFVFTSYFEGMPNVVLEMSQHAIPLVLADVGGLRGTYNDKAAMFVTHQDNEAETATVFSEALDAVSCMDEDIIKRMVVSAYEQAATRHSPEAYIKNVKRVFGV